MASNSTKRLMPAKIRVGWEDCKVNRGASTQKKIMQSVRQKLHGRRCRNLSSNVSLNTSTTNQWWCNKAPPRSIFLCQKPIVAHIFDQFRYWKHIHAMTEPMRTNLSQRRHRWSQCWMLEERVRTHVVGSVTHKTCEKATNTIIYGCIGSQHHGQHSKNHTKRWSIASHNPCNVRHWMLS